MLGTSTRAALRPGIPVTTALAATVLAVTVAAPAVAGAQASAAPGSVVPAPGAAGSLGPGSADAVPQVLPAADRLVAISGSPAGACAGAVSTTLNGIGYPGSSSVSWAFAVVGFGPCDLTATLSWRNLRSGESGQKVAHIPHPRISTGVPAPISHPYDAIISTGSGPVEYTLTTTGGAVAGPIVVETAAWPG